MQEFYTKAQVIQQISIPNSTLYQMVRDGRLHPHLRKGQKRGMVFDVAEIDSLSCQHQAQTVNTPQLLTLELLNELDLAQVAAVSGDWLGQDRQLCFATLRAWWHKNPSLFIGIRDRAGFLWGMTAILPLTLTLGAQICAGECHFADVTADDIQIFSSQQEIACYIPFLRVDVSLPHAEHVAKLLVHTALEHYFMALGHLEIPLTTVYFKDIAEHRDMAIETALMHTHKFHAPYSPDGDSRDPWANGLPGLLVGLAQADSALVSAYYAGKREPMAVRTTCSPFAQLPSLDVTYYEVPGEGVYGPVRDGQYFDPDVGKYVAIAPAPLPGRKPRGRPRKQSV